MLTAASALALSAGQALAQSNSDTITTTTIGEEGHGLSSGAADTQITNSGTISTSGKKADGISSTGADAGITNSGTIMTSGGNAEGISSTGADAEISNSNGGMIETTNRFAEGILSTGADAGISNSGIIETLSEDLNAKSEGIESTGADAGISNSGSITTNGGKSAGIRTEGANAEISNSGTISINGGESEGILALGNNAESSNSGTISTSSTDSVGIASGGLNAEVTNSGSITTNGGKSAGIRTEGANAEISNSGTISINGIESAGILLSGDNAMISNSGTISINGGESVGILALGTDTTIIISGTISAPDPMSHAVFSPDSGVAFTKEELEEIREEIEMEPGETEFGGVIEGGGGEPIVGGSEGGDQTLILLRGARIIGRVNLGGLKPVEPVEPGEPVAPVASNNDVLDIRAYTGQSLTYTIEGVETFLSHGAAFRKGDTFVVLDPTGPSANRIALGAATGQIHRQVFQRQDTPSPDPMADSRVWGSSFGTKGTRDNDGLATAWDHHLYGAVGGRDTRLSSGQVVGLFVGASQGQVKTSEITSIKDSAASVFSGIYGQQAIGDLTLDGAVIVGYARHDSTRFVQGNITGDEIADGKYNSAYISPSLALEGSRKLADGVELRPSAQISYTYGHYGDYTESGTTTSNIKFGSRNVNIMEGRLQLALAQSFAGTLGEIELRGGGTLTHYGHDSVKASLGGGSISYRVPGENIISGGYAGVNLRYNIEDYVTLGGDIEFARSPGDSGSVSGQVGLAVQF